MYGEHKDISRLKSAGYRIIQNTEWHYQVVCRGVVCNIWPTAKKYMIEYGGGASTYQNIGVVKAVENVCGPALEDWSREEKTERRRIRLAEEMAKIKPRYPKVIPIWRAGLDKVMEEVQRICDERATSMDL